MEEQEEEEEEVPLKLQLLPQGSGGSGVLMGPDTQKGLEKHTASDPHTNEHRVVVFGVYFVYERGWLFDGTLEEKQHHSK